MVQIPDRYDPTIAAVNAAIEAEQSPHVSKNIGFGEIGKECELALWNKINLNIPEIFNADTLRIFRNGHEDEAQMAADLRLVEGITLHTHDPDRGNKQYKLDALGGRFTGRLDGVILGLKQAPATWHVWEHKSTKQEKFNKLKKLISSLGEKVALKEWDFVYYCQAQSNMYHAELDRHYMTVGTPGLREVISLRTELDKPFAEFLVQKAKRIIEAKVPPAKIGGPDFYVCKMCRFYGECHGGNNVT